VKTVNRLAISVPHHAARSLGGPRGVAGSNVVALPERFRPAGVAMLLGQNGFARVFLCDRDNHFVDVVDQDARPLFSFGGPGRRPGQFQDPCDVVVIPPADQAPFGVEHVLVAVADRRNSRVQIFDASGTLIALLAPAEGKPRRPGEPPVIRTPIMGTLSRLAWVPPVLVACGSQGEAIRIDLGRALAPTGRTTTARSAIQGVLRRVLADHPVGTMSRASSRLTIHPVGGPRTES
jgi:hypothetical protein